MSKAPVTRSSISTKRKPEKTRKTTDTPKRKQTHRHQQLPSLPRCSCICPFFYRCLDFLLLWECTQRKLPGFVTLPSKAPSMSRPIKKHFTLASSWLQNALAGSHFSSFSVLGRRNVSFPHPGRSVKNVVLVVVFTVLVQNACLCCRVREREQGFGALLVVGCWCCCCPCDDHHDGSLNNVSWQNARQFQTGFIPIQMQDKIKTPDNPFELLPQGTGFTLSLCLGLGSTGAHAAHAMLFGRDNHGMRVDLT